MAPLSPAVLSFERVELVTHTTVQGVLYGLAFALYILCIRALCPQLKDQHRRRQNLATLLHMSLVMACALLGLAVDARDVQTFYVDHANYPGGSPAYDVYVFGTLPIAVMGYAMGIIINSLTFGVQIWRLWVIWRTSRHCYFIVAVPTISLLTYIVIQILYSVRIVQTAWKSFALVAVTLSESLNLVITAVVTLFISARIALVRRRHIKLMGQSDVAGQYTSIIVMLIESFALESIWTIMTIVLFLLEVKGHNTTPEILGAAGFFANTKPFVQIIAYLLVIYRVITGRGWKEDTERKLTTLQWNRDEPQTTQLSTRASLPISHEEA